MTVLLPMTGTEGLADERRSFFREARERVIRESFGGPRTYALLKERNPQIDMIINAGVMAGLAAAQKDVDSECLVSQLS